MLEPATSFEADPRKGGLRLVYPTAFHDALSESQGFLNRSNYTHDPSPDTGVT
jgi:hypothetical protein